MVTYRPRGARGMPRQGPPRDMDQMRGARRDYDMYSPPIRGPTRRRPNYDDELISKTLHVDQKRFYIDLKENGFGKFIKIIESNQNRGSGRNRVIVPQELFQEFIDVLTQYVEILEKSDSADTGENGPADSSERIQTQKITNERKTLYIDLRKNNRGKFLKVTEQSPRNGEERTQVIVPSEGLEVLRDVISEILRVASPPQRPRERDSRERDQRDPREQRGERERRDPRDNRPDPRERRDPRDNRDNRGDRRVEREYREPPRERREPREPREPREHRDKEPREKNRRPRREVENGSAPPPPEPTEGAETDPKPKPTAPNPTDNPGNNEESESSSIDETLPATIEVRSNRKRFYFDARRNEMGVFLQVSEVGEVTRRRRRHINIPHVSWQSCQRALETMLEQLPYEPPEVPAPSEEPDTLLEEGKEEPPPPEPEPAPVDKPEDSKTESS